MPFPIRTLCKSKVQYSLSQARLLAIFSKWTKYLSTSFSQKDGTNLMYFVTSNLFYTEGNAKDTVSFIFENLSCSNSSSFIFNCITILLFAVVFLQIVFFIYFFYSDFVLHFNFSHFYSINHKSFNPSLTHPHPKSPHLPNK